MENQLKELAAQLSCPEGDAGIELGKSMNLGNLAPILNGLANLRLRDHDRVLELGYGNGGLLAYILSLAKDIHYTGLELSATMHQEAIALNQPFIDAALAQYQLYDGITLPFDNETFDKILTVNTIYFWSQPSVLLNNIYNVLKTDGYFCLTFCDKTFMQQLPFVQYGFRLYDTDEVKQLIGTLPFKLVNEDYRQDTCISKAGTLVNREFSTLVWQKTV